MYQADKLLLCPLLPMATGAAAGGGEEEGGGGAEEPDMKCRTLLLKCSQDRRWGGEWEEASTWAAWASEAWGGGEEVDGAG